MKTNAAAKTPPLTISDCAVVGANGSERPDGGIRWNGVLTVRGLPIARFSNDGNGGCCEWDVRPTAEGRATFEEFKAMAIALHPELSFEQHDHVVGGLWDFAICPPPAASAAH